MANNLTYKTSSGLLGKSYVLQDVTSNIFYFAPLYDGDGNYRGGCKLLRIYPATGGTVILDLQAVNYGWEANSAYNWGGYARCTHSDGTSVESLESFRTGDSVYPEYYGSIQLYRTTAVKMGENFSKVLYRNEQYIQINEDWAKTWSQKIFDSELSNYIQFFARYTYDGYSHTTITDSLSGSEIIDSCTVPSATSGTTVDTSHSSGSQSSCMTFVNGKGIIGISNNTATQLNSNGEVIGVPMNITVYMRVRIDNEYRLFSYRPITLKSTYNMTAETEGTSEDGVGEYTYKTVAQFSSTNGNYFANTSVSGYSTKQTITLTGVKANIMRQTLNAKGNVIDTEQKGTSNLTSSWDNDVDKIVNLRVNVEGQSQSLMVTTGNSVYYPLHSTSYYVTLVGSITSTSGGGSDVTFEITCSADVDATFYVIASCLGTDYIIGTVEHKNGAFTGIHYHSVTVGIESSSSSLGTVSLSNSSLINSTSVQDGQSATFYATPGTNNYFVGWYTKGSNTDGTPLQLSSTYTMQQITADVDLVGKFGTDILLSSVSGNIIPASGNEGNPLTQVTIEYSYQGTSRGSIVAALNEPVECKSLEYTVAEKTEYKRTVTLTDADAGEITFNVSVYQSANKLYYSEIKWNTDGYTSDTSGNYTHTYNKDSVSEFSLPTATQTMYSDAISTVKTLNLPITAVFSSETSGWYSQTQTDDAVIKVSLQANSTSGTREVDITVTATGKNEKTDSKNIRIYQTSSSSESTSTSSTALQCTVTSLDTGTSISSGSTIDSSVHRVSLKFWLLTTTIYSDDRDNTYSYYPISTYSVSATESYNGATLTASGVSNSGSIVSVDYITIPEYSNSTSSRTITISLQANAYSRKFYLTQSAASSSESTADTITYKYTLASSGKTETNAVALAIGGTRTASVNVYFDRSKYVNGSLSSTDSDYSYTTVSYNGFGKNLSATSRTYTVENQSFTYLGSSYSKSITYTQEAATMTGVSTAEVSSFTVTDSSGNSIVSGSTIPYNSASYTLSHSGGASTIQWRDSAGNVENASGSGTVTYKVSAGTISGNTATVYKNAAGDSSRTVKFTVLVDGVEASRYVSVTQAAQTYESVYSLKYSYSFGKEYIIYMGESVSLDLTAQYCTSLKYQDGTVVVGESWQTLPSSYLSVICQEATISGSNGNYTLKFSQNPYTSSRSIMVVASQNYINAYQTTNGYTYITQKGPND